MHDKEREVYNRAGGVDKRLCGSGNERYGTDRLGNVDAFAIPWWWLLFSFTHHHSFLIATAHVNFLYILYSFFRDGLKSTHVAPVFPFPSFLSFSRASGIWVGEEIFYI